MYCLLDTREGCELSRECQRVCAHRMAPRAPAEASALEALDGPWRRDLRAVAKPVPPPLPVDWHLLDC